MTPPPRPTPEQNAEGRRKAQETMAVRAKALAALRAGTITLADVLSDEDSPLWQARVRTVLRAIPGVGPVREDRILDRLCVAKGRRLRGLGVNQRAALEAEFGIVPA